MPVARAWSLDAARRARLGFSGSKTKLAFWKSNVRARLLREAQQAKNTRRQFTCLQMGKQSAGTTNAKGHSESFPCPFAVCDSGDERDRPRSDFRAEISD